MRTLNPHARPARKSPRDRLGLPDGVKIRFFIFRLLLLKSIKVQWLAKKM